MSLSMDPDLHPDSMSLGQNVRYSRGKKMCFAKLGSANLVTMDSVVRGVSVLC